MNANQMTSKGTPRRLALRPQEAAAALGISPRKLWQLTADGEVPCVRLGSGNRGAVLYAVSDLEAWLQNRSETVKTAAND